jgi:YfiH family protein
MPSLHQTHTATIDRPLVRVPAALASGAWRGGLTTRIGFPGRRWGNGDQASRRELRRRLAGWLSRPPEDLAWARQIHGADVAIVEHGGFQGVVDALVSANPRVVPVVAVADCGPVLLWEDRGEVFGVAHAGWRGVLAGVCERTVGGLVGLGADPSRLCAWIGPCIGPENFEVGPEVADRFDPRFVRPADGTARCRPHIDLPGAIAAALQRAGVMDDRIVHAGDDTYARQELYFSYRRDGGICGRHLGYLCPMRS